MKKSTIVVNTFSIERTYPVSAERVFEGFSNLEMKKRWFFESEGFNVHEVTMDFREGGVEFSRFDFKGGPPMTNRTYYHSIVENSRLVFSYDMTLGGKVFSASMASVEIFVEGNGARLVYTEQTHHLDAADKPGGREAGCRALYERLARVLS